MRPSFQFYPGDWRREQGLRLCSMAARGLWIEAMALMHDCEPYGHLTVGGKPMTPDQLARLIGEPNVKAVRGWLQELITAGVPSHTTDGIIYSRRMVRDEAIRNARAEGGKAGANHGSKGASHGVKGGRPRKDQRGHETGESKTPLQTPLHENKEPPKNPPPSSSSSSSSSETSNEVSFGADATGAKAPRKARRPAKVDQKPDLAQILGDEVMQRRYWKTAGCWPKERNPKPRTTARLYVSAVSKAQDVDLMQRLVFMAASAYREQHLPPHRERDETQYMLSFEKWLEEEGWTAILQEHGEAWTQEILQERGHAA